MEIYAVYNGEKSLFQNQLAIGENTNTYTTLTVIFDRNETEILHDDIEKFVLVETPIDDIEFIKPIGEIAFFDIENKSTTVIIHKILLNDNSGIKFVKKIKSGGKYISNGVRGDIHVTRLENKEILNLTRNELIEVNCSASRIKPYCPPTPKTA